jgi:transmembrane sensor
MKPRMSRPALDPATEASRWFVKVEAGLNPRDRRRLDAWLAAAPRHRAAYEALRDADLALARQGGDAALLAMRDAALRPPPEPRWPARALAACLVGALLVLGGIGIWRPPGLFDRGSSTVAAGRYVTAAGERATVTLTDGSVLTLNTDSAAEVTFDTHARRVRLERGQALFVVAHDPDRPFEVQVNDRRVTAVGTAFDVMVLPNMLRVAMLEGVVRVGSDKGDATQTLSRGEVLTARRDGSSVVRKADADRLAGWRDGAVYFEDTPLAEAAEEMSRYATRPIVIGDADTAGLRVSGAFRINEANRFAETMADLFSLSIKHSAGGQTVLSDPRV